MSDSVERIAAELKALEGPDDDEIRLPTPTAVSGVTPADPNAPLEVVYDPADYAAEGDDADASTSTARNGNELNALQEEMDALSEALSRSEVTRAAYAVRQRATEARRERAIAATPHFWAHVLCAHGALGSFITTNDCIALRALRSVRCSSRGRDFDVVFHFDLNALFHNTSLTKTYRYRDLEGLVIGCDVIRWKEGMAPEAGMPTFYRFFTDAEDPHTLGELLREEIIPNCVALFYGSFKHTDLHDPSDDDTNSTASTNSFAGTSPMPPESAAAASNGTETAATSSTNLSVSGVGASAASGMTIV